MLGRDSQHELEPKWLRRRVLNRGRIFFFDFNFSPQQRAEVDAEGGLMKTTRASRFIGGRAERTFMGQAKRFFTFADVAEHVSNRTVKEFQAISDWISGAPGWEAFSPFSRARTTEFIGAYWDRAMRDLTDVGKAWIFHKNTDPHLTSFQ